MNLVDAILANRTRVPMMGTVSSPAEADGTCGVVVADGEVRARLSDQIFTLVAVGDVVALLPIGDTYLAVATVGSTGGGGGVSLGSNLIPNPGFEFGSDQADGWGAWPWVSDGVTSQRDATPGESVSGSARIVQTLTGGTDVIANVWTLGAVMVDPGTVYRASAWVKAGAITSDLTCSLYVITAPTAAGANFFGDASTVTEVGVIVGPGGAYQLSFGDVTIPPGHGFARLFLRSVSDHPSPLTVSWDEAAFQQRIT